MPYLIDLNKLGYFKGKENAMLADDYSATSTYKAGDLCVYNGTLKKAKQDINTAEAYTAGHWEDAVLGNEVTDLKNALSDLDNTVFEYQKKVQETNITSTSIAGSTHIMDLTDPIQQGMQFTLKVEDPDSIINLNSSGKKNITVYRANSSNERTSLGALLIGGTYTYTAEDNIAYFTGYKAANSVTPPGNLVVTCTYETSLSDNSLVRRMNTAETDIDNLQKPVSDIAHKSSNLLDTTEITEGYYMNASGNTNENEEYGYTDYIPVTPGDVLWYSCGDARCITAFDSNKNAISASGSNSEVSSGNYTVPDSIYYVILSFTLSNITNYSVVNVGDALADYEAYGEWFIDSDAIESIPATKITGLAIEQTFTLLGSDSATTSADSLASGTTLELTAAPWFIKKNVGITARMEFDSFTGVTVGKGYEAYRGRWIVVDDTNITPYYYNGTETVTGTAVAHGLTISDFLQVTIFMTADGIGRISINTLTGTFTTTVDYGFEWNYCPFIFGSQSMTNVNLTYSCADLRCPLWLFGDSYMGVAVNRIAGQLKNLGYFNYLINAIAGARATDSGTPGKSSYDDLERMLEFSTPKYLIWSLGMNGGDSSNVSFLPTLVSLCEDKNIELILYLPPSVPEIDHTTLNTYIESLNIRYIDGNAAVGATSTGVWYTDFLSTDNVHPSSLGAKALAMRFLCDAPELMNYGYSTGTVESEIEGDET